MRTWELLIDLLFPPSPVELLVRKTTPTTMHLEYSPHLIHELWALSHYKRPLIQATITTNKFSSNQHSAKLLAVLLETWLKERHIKNALLVPIPLHPIRRRKRGYNQVTHVLEHILMPDVRIDETILTRERNTIPQTTLSRASRLHNVKDALFIHKEPLTHFLENGVTTIIICDDVTTTGSTLREACAALAPHIPPTCTLTGVALAH